MATYTPLSTDFKDDILASQNSKRKYTQVNNSDGTVSFQDSTAYSQVGSSYGAKEVNEEREAINNIYANKLVTLDEIDLVTEPGFFVDAQVVKELNSKMMADVQFKPFSITGNPVGSSSYVITSLTSLKKIFGDAVTVTNSGAIVMNGDGNATDAHFESATWQNDNLYAVFNKTVNTNIRITGLLYYAPVTVLNNGNI